MRPRAVVSTVITSGTTSSASTTYIAAPFAAAAALRLGLSRADVDRDPVDDMVLAEQGLCNPETKVIKVDLLKEKCPWPTHLILLLQTVNVFVYC